MLNFVHQADPNPIIDALDIALEARSTFLEACLRTDCLPGTTQSLKEAMSDSLNWHSIILNAIKTHADDWGKQVLQGRKDHVARNAMLRVLAEENANTKLENELQARLHRSAEVSLNLRDTYAHPTPEQGRIEIHARDEVTSFVEQHLLYFFVNLALPKDNQPRADLAHLDRCIFQWHTWLPKELLSFYDATILEILAGRSLAGRPSLDAYQASLDAALKKQFGSSSPVPLFENHVPARVNLESLLLGAPADKRIDLLWSFIQDWRGSREGVRKLLDRGEQTARWIIGLVEQSTFDSKAGAPYTLKLFVQMRATGRDRWFFDPVRVRKVIDAADAITHSAAQPGEPYPSHEAADAIEDARRLFLASARDARKCHEEDKRRRKYPRSHRAQPLEERDWKESVELEKIWWSSFDRVFHQSNSPWNSTVLAAYCHGSGYAYWNLPQGNTRKPVVKHLKCELEKTRTSGTVTIFGSGIAGMTAAHELAERGFKVLLVESAAPVNAQEEFQPGGLARTHWAEASTLKRTRSGEPAPVYTLPAGHAIIPATAFPGEHGYRLFPSFYRHVFDTMKRTPIVASKATHGIFPTAFDQLQPTFQQVFARRASFVPLSRTRPRSLESFRVEYMSLTEGLGFERRDLTRFFFKLVRYLMSSTRRRAEQYENMSLLDFLGGEDWYSRPFVEAIKAAPQALVAMNAKQCDARTQANIYLQLLLDQVLGSQYTDSTLRGPTSTYWLDPWREYLKQIGVHFLNAKLLSILRPRDSSNAQENQVLIDLQCPHDEGPPNSTAPATVAEKQDFIKKSSYFVIALDPVSAEQVTCGWESTGVPSDLRRFASYVDVALPKRVDRYTVSIPFRAPVHRQIAEAKLRNLLDLITSESGNDDASPRVRSAFRSLDRATGELVPSGDFVDEYRVSLWFQRRIGPDEIGLIEQTLSCWLPDDEEARLTSYEPEWFDDVTTVNTPRLPEQLYGDDPRDRFQTFTGIQYYFAQDFKLVRGHVYFPDTEWGLSAVSQSQFWWHEPPALPLNVRGALSVDIGACRQKSSYTGKTLLESSPDEIRREVWRQIKGSLRTTRGATSLVTSLPLPSPTYYHLDEGLVFAGEDLRKNLTPFLINNASDWAKRPRCSPWVPGESKFVDGARSDGTDVWQAPQGGYRIHDDQIVFCGHYMRTFTRMSTMEAANESARHAVNAILSHLAHAKDDDPREMGGVSGDYCQIWDIEQNELEDLGFFKRVDEKLFAAGKPHIADILQFDKIADLQHPELSPGQALATALGTTFAKDWGVQPGELVGGLNGLVDVARKLGKDLGGASGGSESPIMALLSMLGIGKGISGGAPDKR
ncbi:MAG: FAD-binding protein [Byssovorax sp.]